MATTVIKASFVMDMQLESDTDLSPRAAAELSTWLIERAADDGPASDFCYVAEDGPVVKVDVPSLWDGPPDEDHPWVRVDYACTLVFDRIVTSAAPIEVTGGDASPDTAVCPRCERTVEVHHEGWLFDHLAVPGSDEETCPGSGERVRP